MMIILMIAESLGLGIAKSQQMETTHYQITLPAMMDSGSTTVRFAHLSDLHFDVYGKNNQDLVDLVAMQEPDIIVSTGDMIDAKAASYDDTINLFQRLVAIAPVFYSIGNHEDARKDLAQIITDLQNVGVTVVNNNVSIINVNGVVLHIGGALYTKHVKSLTKSNPMDVLLCHIPDSFDTIVANKVPLAFCGDAHGGQIRIPIVNQPAFAPGQGLFPKYGAGHFVKDGSHMIVSRGLGNSTFPFRVYNPPELIIVDVTYTK